MINNILLKIDKVTIIKIVKGMNSYKSKFETIFFIKILFFKIATHNLNFKF